MDVFNAAELYTLKWLKGKYYVYFTIIKKLMSQYIMNDDNPGPVAEIHYLNSRGQGKSGPNTLVTREMQINYYFIPIRLSKFRKLDSEKC